jgi:hypothetical protein
MLKDKIKKKIDVKLNTNLMLKYQISKKLMKIKGKKEGK